MSEAFRDIIGNGRAIGLLTEDLQRPAQAYLFIGAAGVGKGTVAMRLAAALLCPERGDHREPCSVCRRVAGGIHPDVVVVEPEGRAALTVDQARDTVTAANLTPLESSRKVFVFPDSGAMTEAAANSLLKTLEEPSESTHFVLVSESEADLPDTVSSRCRTVHFGRVTDQEVEAALVQRGVTESKAAEVARISGGRPGLALMLAEEGSVAEFRKIWLGLAERVSPVPGEAFLLAEVAIGAASPMLAALGRRHGELPKEKRDRELRRATQAFLVSGLEIMASWYADAAAAQLGARVRNSDVPVSALTALTPREAVGGAGLVMEALDAIRANQRPQVVLANLFATLGTRG